MGDDENYDDESDIKGLGLVAGHLDKRSSLTLQQAVHESLRSAGKKKVKENMDSSDDDDNEKEERVAEIHGKLKLKLFVLYEKIFFSIFTDIQFILYLF